MIDRFRKAGSQARYRIRATTDHLRYRWQPLRARLMQVRAVELVVRTIQELGADDATHMAAGVAYYAILSLFPLIIGLVAVLGLFLSSERIKAEVIDFFEQNLPGLTEVFETYVAEQASDWGAALGVLALIGLFWSASAMFGAITRAVNRAWDVHRDRPFYIRKARDLGMALGTGFLFLVSVSATSVFSIIRNLELPLASTAADIGARLFALLVSFSVFLIIYKLVPNTKTYWRYIWPGALLAAVVFEAGKSLFVLYLDRFADYGSAYGNLGSIIALLVWIFVSALILIVGAEFSSEYGRICHGCSRGVPIASMQGASEEGQSS